MTLNLMITDNLNSTKNYSILITLSKLTSTTTNNADSIKNISDASTTKNTSNPLQ